MSHQLQGAARRADQRRVGQPLPRPPDRRPRRAVQVPHIEYVREAGSEGIELVMWDRTQCDVDVPRGATWPAAGGKTPTVRHRFFHVPASNTAVGHPKLLLGEQRMAEVWMKTSRSRLPGAGAFGIKHLDAIQLIDGVGSSRWSAASSRRPRRRRRATASATSAPSSPTAWRAGRRRGHPVHADADARRAEPRLPARASMCRSRSLLADSLRAPREVVALQRRPASSRCAATRGASTRATSTCTGRSRRARSTSSRWTCRPTSSGART